MKDPEKLKRSLSLPLITFYGLGTILGAGIYVLIGEVAAEAGFHAPLSFLLASFIAGFSAFSFAELSSRYPKSAGPALYMHSAFGFQLLSTVVGILVISIGVISAAAISKGFTGYLHVFFDFPDWLAISGIVISLGLIAIWGINESVFTISLMTTIELLGLLIIIWIGKDSLLLLPERMPEMLPPSDLREWPTIFSGAILAFYAFIGFEDMVSVAEEIKEPKKNLPRAIIISLFVTTFLYITIALIAILAMPIDQLAGSHAPLAMLYQYKTGSPPTLITLISLFAVINGALVQIIMGSRVLYGLSSQGWLPAAIGKIHPRTRTPVRATLLLTAIILVMALWLPLVTLARITSLITLAVFACINAALLVIKRREGTPMGVQTYPGWIPLAGLFTSSLIIFLELMRFLP
ncbi:MAG: amino acid permease [Desulfobulbaceae bacterium]|uniref:Amino acid permease n=1 Tax=Candidatus Desulfobia pelagia TaxID=2841692 RepID=A0A8J6N9L7_9BACT|nr:amino acid permease [Candidatus Desulfobia pelagia]